MCKLDDHIIAETDTSGQTLREYIWLGDIPLAVVDKVATGSPVIYYVHADHLGRPARMTAQNRAWVWDVIYSPFGETSYIWTNPGTIDIRFPGQWFQLESGLAYNWHRHYDATLGRYLQPDPLRVDSKGPVLDGIPTKMRTAESSVITPKRALLADGPSVFGYVGQNPISKSDPFGLYGTQSCRFYAQSCGRHGGSYECGLGMGACRFFKRLEKNNWGDCVRQCLQEKSKQRRPNFCENVGDHSDCFWGCGWNSENPYDRNGPPLPDADISP